jgi:hypothetical protein
MMKPGPDGFEYRGWLVYLEPTCLGELVSGRAELFRDGRYQCKIVLAKQMCEWGVARETLRDKARKMIDEWTTALPRKPNPPAVEH